MDYETKPASREDLRKYAGYLRQLFDVPQAGPFPVLEVLERLPDIFAGCSFQVVEDKEFPFKTMAQCTINEDGGMVIEIKESVYKGAYEKQIGAYLGFICHEICHVFLFKIGFVPILSRSFAEGAVPAYRSVEWQAKALCAEVMIPFDETKEMGITRIMDEYHVSKAFAVNRKKLK